MTDSDLQSALAASLEPVADEGFSERVIARIQAEDLLARIAPEPRSRRWALPALALSAGLVAGTIVRSLPELPVLPATDLGTAYLYAAAGLAALVFWLVADPDALA